MGPPTGAVAVLGEALKREVDRDEAISEILPGVVTVISGKLKDDTTPDAITDALRKAGLFEEQ